jgi:hypothetical protein
MEESKTVSDDRHGAGADPPLAYSTAELPSPPVDLLSHDPGQMTEVTPPAPRTAIHAEPVMPLSPTETVTTVTLSPKRNLRPHLFSPPHKVSPPRIITAHG